MMVVLNLKIAWDKCFAPTQDLDKAEFYIGDMVLLKNHAPTSEF